MKLQSTNPQKAAFSSISQNAEQIVDKSISKIKGGFSSFSLKSIDPEDKNKKSDCSNNNYVQGCSC